MEGKAASAQQQAESAAKQLESANAAIHTLREREEKLMHREKALAAREEAARKSEQAAPMARPLATPRPSTPAAPPPTPIPARAATSMPLAGTSMPLAGASGGVLTGEMKPLPAPAAAPAKAGAEKWKSEDLGNELHQSFVLGTVPPEVIAGVAKVLKSLGKKLKPEEREELTQLAGGTNLMKMSEDLDRSLDPAAHRQRAIEIVKLPAGQEPSAAQVKIARMEMTTEAYKPFQNPSFCARLMQLKNAHRKA